jgi:hypothetical protein
MKTMQRKIQGVFDIVAGGLLVGLALVGYDQANLESHTVKAIIGFITVFALVYVLANNRLGK